MHKLLCFISRKNSPLLRLFCFFS